MSYFFLYLAPLCTYYNLPTVFYILSAVYLKILQPTQCDKMCVKILQQIRY